MIFSNLTEQMALNTAEEKISDKDSVPVVLVSQKDKQLLQIKEQHIASSNQVSHLYAITVILQKPGSGVLAARNQPGKQILLCKKF